MSRVRIALPAFFYLRLLFSFVQLRSTCSRALSPRTTHWFAKANPRCSTQLHCVEEHLGSLQRTQGVLGGCSAEQAYRAVNWQRSYQFWPCSTEGRTGPRLSRPKIKRTALSAPTRVRQRGNPRRVAPRASASAEGRAKPSARAHRAQHRAS